MIKDNVRTMKERIFNRKFFGFLRIADRIQFTGNIIEMYIKWRKFFIRNNIK